MADRNIDTATVTANWRNSSPEMPGMNATGTNTDSRTSVIAMIGAVISRHGALGRLGGRELGVFLHHALDVLDDHDGIVDHDADREHDGEQRYRIGGIADRIQHDERADQADRHGKGRDQASRGCCRETGRPPARRARRLRSASSAPRAIVSLTKLVGIVGDLPGQILRKALLGSAMRLPSPRRAWSIALAPGDW